MEDDPVDESGEAKVKVRPRSLLVWCLMSRVQCKQVAQRE